MNYRKILIAKHVPKNLCFAQEGEILVPASSMEKMPGRKLPNDHHFFVGVQTALSSRYGWVKELEEFITAEGLAQLKDGDETKDETIQLCELLLKSVTNLQGGTPVACHFAEVGLPPRPRRKELKIHKVIFYST